MTKTSNKIVFFGNERLATGVTTTAPTLRALIEAGYEICALVSSYTKANSRQNREPEIHTVARNHNIPILLPNKIKDIAGELRVLKAEVGVLVAFGKIIPQSIIDIFPYGIINIHPSLLPKHRGPTPIESFILSGETTTGVSIMQLSKEMDAGPVYGQASVKLETDCITKQTLADDLLEQGKDLLVNLLPTILSDSLEVTPQDNTKASYDAMITKQDAFLDPRHKTAVQLEREIRAYRGWPGSKMTITGIEVIIVDAFVANYEIHPGKDSIPFSDPLKQICVPCKEGVLVVTKLKPLGKNEMSSAAFLNGYARNL